MTVTYEEMIPNVRIRVPNCPELVIEGAIKDAVNEVCYRSGIYAVDFVGTLDRQTNETSLQSLLSEGHPSLRILRLLGVYYKQQVLKELDADSVINYYPDYTAGGASAITEGKPVYFALRKGTDDINIMLFPRPDSDNFICRFYVVVQPNSTSVSVPDYLYDLLREAIFHGALQRILTMQSKPWAELELASYHAKQYVFHLSAARADNNISYYTSRQLRVKARRF